MKYHILCVCLVVGSLVQMTVGGFLDTIRGAVSHSQSSQRPSDGLPAAGSSSNPDMSVSDPNAETVSDSPQATEPRGDDFAKMLSGAIKSVLEYEEVKKNAASDKRPLSVFYDGLGWFYRNGTLSNLNRLPITPEQMNTKFMLYTRQDQKDPELLSYQDISTIQRSSFNPGLPTFILTHGFKTSKGQAGLQWVMLFVDGLFRHLGPGNYIVTDWSAGAQAPDYWGAAANTQLVGAELAKLMILIQQAKQASINNFSLMGFSLGAHASGFAGKRLRMMGIAERPQRIFGIDPAGPLFENANPDGRLSKGDAQFVVAEHGSADGLKNGGLGIWQQLGDVDFYANGGREQPGCGNMVSSAINQLLKLNFKGVPEAIRCNHDRNWMYILETFDSQCQFGATACDIFGHVRGGACSSQSPDPNQSISFFGNYRPSSSPMFFDTVEGAVKQTTCQNHLKITIQAAKQSISGRGTFVISFTDKNGGETSPFIIAQDGRVPAGKQAFLLVRSVVPPSAIQSMKVTFHRACDQGNCNADTINLQTVTVATINNDIILRYCGGGDLVSEQTKEMPLKSGNCPKNG